MPTTTPKLALIKPATVGEVIDVSQLNANSDAIDLNIGYRICTSTTRPAAPYQGMQILETDTGLRGYWDGVRWRRSTRQAEFTTYIAGAGNGTLYNGLGTITQVPAGTTDAAFCTVQGSGLLLHEPGIFAVLIVISMPAVATGRSFVTLDGWTVGLQANAQVGEGGIALVHPNLRTTTATTALSFRFMQTTGASQNINGRIVVTKIDD